MHLLKFKIHLIVKQINIVAILSSGAIFIKNYFFYILLALTEISKFNLHLWMIKNSFLIILNNGYSLIFKIINEKYKGK